MPKIIKSWDAIIKSTGLRLPIMTQFLQYLIAPLLFKKKIVIFRNNPIPDRKIQPSARLKNVFWNPPLTNFEPINIWHVNSEHNLVSINFTGKKRQKVRSYCLKKEKKVMKLYNVDVSFTFDKDVGNQIHKVRSKCRITTWKHCF